MVKEREVKPSCNWDPTDLKHFMETTHDDLQRSDQFYSPANANTTTSTSTSYPTPLQIPSHSYEPKYYLNVSFHFISLNS